MRFAVLALASLTFAAPALAQPICRLVGTRPAPSLECIADGSCSDASDCDRADLMPLCVSGIGCVPHCGTLFQCGETADCTERVDPASVCIPVTGGPLLGAGICAGVGVVYCSETAGVVTIASALACHTLPHSDTLAPAWGDGDCDSDGCPNGYDVDPCDPTSTTCTFGGAPPILLCPERLVTVRGERCALVGDEVSCSTPHACAAACRAGFACNAARVCEPTGCSFFSCRAESDCAIAGVGGAACIPAPTLFAGGSGDGFCAIGLDDSCVGLGEACLTTPEGILTADLEAGDCDGDLCPNRLDSDPCVHGGACAMEGVSSCGTPLIPPPEEDAGMIADAGAPDAAVDPDAALPDGGVPFDAAGMDGGRPVSISFGGGGGCRCDVAARRGLSPLWLLLGLALLLRR